MKRASIIIAVLTICFFDTAYSVGFHPTVSLLGGPSTINNRSNISSGAFEIDNRKINFGFEMINRFYLGNKYFINSGIRYNHFKTSIYGINQIEELHDNPAPLHWERRYENIVLPILFGRELACDNGNMFSIYAGTSIGVLMTSYAKNEVVSSYPKNIYYTDLIQTEMVDNTNQTPTVYSQTIDFGLDYQPFMKFSNFTIGALCSIQLTKSDKTTYSGTVTNMTTLDTYKYEIQHQQHFINYSLLLSYTIGKKVKKDRSFNKTACYNK